MYKTLALFILFAISLSHTGTSQCLIEVDNNGFEYNVDVDVSVTDAIYTQSGSTCNVELEVTYDVTIDITNQPGWWNENLYVLQAFFDCDGASGTSFFDLPNEGGSGTVTSAIFSYANQDCGDVILDCPITVQVQGPELNETTICGTYSNAALPVILASFDYERIEGNEVELKWATYSETNFSHFELEESNDLRNWGIVSTVYSSNSTNGAEYQYIISTKNQEQYVRLKIIDIDGHTEYSQVLVITSDSPDNLTVYPNPVTNSLNISGVNTAQVEIINNIGQVSKLQIDSDQSIDVSSLAPGYYFIQVIASNGNNQTVKFVKQ